MGDIRVDIIIHVWVVLRFMLGLVLKMMFWVRVACEFCLY